MRVRQITDFFFFTCFIWTYNADKAVIAHAHKYRICLYTNHAAEAVQVGDRYIKIIKSALDFLEPTR